MCVFFVVCFFFFKQKTAYEMRISDLSSDVCSSDLKGGLRNAVQSLSVAASPNILFVDISESGDPLNDINGLAEVCEPGTVVIAAGQVNDVRLYRDLISSGLQDYLLKPFGADQLREVFTQRSEEHTSELQSLMRTSYAVFCLKK